MDISVFGQVNHTPTDSEFQNFTLHPSLKVALLAKVDRNYPWISQQSLTYLSVTACVFHLGMSWLFIFTFHFNTMGKFPTFLKRQFNRLVSLGFTLLSFLIVYLGYFLKMMCLHIRILHI